MQTSSIDRVAPVESDPLVPALWRRFRKTRSEAARNRLVENYQPLVRSIASRVLARLPPYVDSDDLRSAGIFGLLDAIDHFDPERGVRFETFCRKRVSGAMLDELRRQDPIPREARERAAVLQRTIARLQQELGRDPSQREVARALNVPLESFQVLLADLTFAACLPLDVSDDGDPDDTGHSARYEPVDALPEPPELAYRRELVTLVNHFLSATERTIVRGYYHDDQSMKRIGTRLRLSESRVCQMHSQLLNRLKARLNHLNQEVCT